MRGFELGVGIASAVGYATLGVIGSDKRVTSLSSRLSNEALHGQILTAGPVVETVRTLVKSEFII